MIFCHKPLSTRSKFPAPGGHRCYMPTEHTGPCIEYPYLLHLAEAAPRVEAKIVRDAIMTTGASWKSEDAGPNRIRRWAMQLSDEDLLALGINMSALKPIVIAKLREKAASYEDCMAVAKKLTWQAYGMSNSPVPPEAIREYLENLFGPINPGTTTCLICREALDFGLFEGAKRGKAELETSHRNPRLHTPDNVGFAHRSCNIAQGNKTLDDFYAWIAAILRRVGFNVTNSS